MITLIEAYTYFNEERLFADKWLELEEAKQNQSLKMAENQINSLKINVDINDIDYKKAVFEQALYLLETQGNNRSKLIEQGVTSFSVEGLSESYDLNKVKSNNKICSEAMQYLRKFTRGGYEIC